MFAVSLCHLLLARFQRASAADTQRKAEDQLSRAVSSDQHPAGKETTMPVRLHVDRRQSIRYCAIMENTDVSHTKEIKLNQHRVAATHLIKCKRISAYPVEDSAPSGMLDSLGLVPKTAEVCVNFVHNRFFYFLQSSLFRSLNQL